MNKRLLKINITVIITILLPFVAIAAINSDEITLVQNKNHYNLGRNLYILEDKSNSIAFEDIIQKKYDSQFIKNQADIPNYGFTNSTYWIKFKITNLQLTSEELYLKIGNPLINFIELYIPNSDNSYQKKIAGNHFTFKNRELQYRSNVFKISLNNADNVFYLRIKSSSSMSLPVILQTPEYFIENTLNEYIVLGVYYGILIVMIFYNLFVYTTVRDKNYLYYIIYITSNLMTMMSLNGISFQYFWPNNAWWTNISIPFFVFSNAFTVTLFSSSFLNLKKFSPGINRVLILVMIVSIFGMTSSFFLNYSIAIRFATITCAIGTPLIFIGCIFSLLKGYRSARFYIIAWASLLIGIVTLALESYGFLPSNIFTKYGYQISSAAEVILLSLALGDRINILKEENEAAQLRTIEIQKNATENLERKVAERTLELNKANDDLKELDKLKSNFFANISHEIRTPLTLILSPVESVLQGDYDGKIDNKFFENLQRNAVRLLKLINNLLDFSKIEAGRMNLKIQKVEIVTFIRNYISSVHSAAESKGITMNFVSMSSAVPLLIDIEKLDKIIMNLFSNSLKFTDEGGFITVSVRDDDENCYIDFEDSGIGIPSDKLESVFDRFSQVDTGSTRKYEGTGIGLALVKEFVELHGGRITVRSNFINESPDKHGTIFTVKIPKGEEHFNNNENVQFVESSELDESVPDYRFFGMREMTDLKQEKDDVQVIEDNYYKSDIDILIVEDNPDMQNFLKFLLHKHYNVHLASDGEEGFNTASELQPDLIISDVMMPIMNGYEMTRKIKEDNLLKRTPVIMLTAKSDISSKIEGIEYGADDYLTKPFNSKELLTRVKMLLKTRNYEIAIEKRNHEIEEELKIARLIQQRLLPQNIPDISGYKFHPTYIPMDKVGGDFYDFKTNGNLIEIFITDVSGHGLVSAFISMIAKMAYDSIYIKNSCTHVLYQLNDILCNSTVNSNYMTTFFCLIDRETNIMRYSNAGHLSPIVYRKEADAFYELNAKGKPLGWFTNLELAEEQIQLMQGDRVLFYTDGITECADPDKQLFEEERFKNYIRKNAHMEPELFSHNLIYQLKSFCRNDKFSDDLCLLVFDVY
jgi:signal transduction histidine kinase/serine phosphatase RsbU (regulator of sigma subunit)